MDEVRVMVKFTTTEGKLSYTDALYYDYDSYASVPKPTIDAAKQARFNAWKTELAKPQPPIDLDAAILDCQKQIAYYTQQKADYTAQKAELGGGK